jgi:Ni/Co efflux regulator RcnB
MKKSTQLIGVLLTSSLCLLQGSAWAQDNHGNDRRDNGRGNNQHVAQGQGHGGERGAGPGHSYYRGDRLPSNYRGNQYVVDDWRGHGLRSPPRGYHWVQTGGDYVLAAIATGVIADLLLNR